MGDQGQSSPNPDGGSPQGAPSEPPEWFKSYSRDVEERFARMSQKHQDALAELRKGGTQAKQQQDPRRRRALA